MVRRFKFEVRSKVLRIDGTAEVMGESTKAEAEQYLRGILATADRAKSPLVIREEGIVQTVQAKTEDME